MTQLPTSEAYAWGGILLHPHSTTIIHIIIPDTLSQLVRARDHAQCNASYPGFHYGSGPVPSTAQPFAHHVPSGMPTNGLGVDPLWLGDLVQKAVKQGVEESQRIKMPLAAQPEQNEHPSEQNLRSQLPGAWPISPFSTPAELNQQFQQTAK